MLRVAFLLPQILPRFIQSDAKQPAAKRRRAGRLSRLNRPNRHLLERIFCKVTVLEHTQQKNLQIGFPLYA